MLKKLHPVTRILCLVTALALATVVVLPIWRIELSAPQYPEGLYMQIYASKLAGNVDVINGLNHYIGMSQIHEKDFVEFQVLPYIIGILAAFGIITAIVNRKWFFSAWFVFFAMFGIIAMIDFYRWEYNYGHNLNPEAPIRVPGMAYQPPLIGFKQLLNFGAYSIPDTGGWIFIAVALILLVGCWIEIKSILKKPNQMVSGLVLLALAAGLGSCNTGPAPIPYGKSACEFCQMTILDPKFGSELVTTKGKIFYFDDLHCLLSYQKEKKLEASVIAGRYVGDYNGKGELIAVEKAYLAMGEAIHGPMGGKVAAFTTAAARDAFNSQYHTQSTDWNSLLQP